MNCTGVLVQRAVVCVHCVLQSWEAILLQKRWGAVGGALALGPLAQSPWGRRGRIPPFVSLVAEALRKQRGTGALAAANPPVLRKPWRRRGRGAYCSHASLGLQAVGTKKAPFLFKSGV